jgi:peptidyl-tRNA hydrolase
MTPAYQAIQSGHAAIQFQYDYPDIAKEWYDNSNYLIYLSVENENELKRLIHRLEKSNIKYSVFRESDIDNQITAIAIEPSDKTRRLVSNLPLMLKECNIFNKIDKNTYKDKEESYVC